MADELALFWVHTTSVRTYEGSGPFGETYADPVDVPCFIDNTRKLVRDQTGREVTSEATITGPVTKAAHFTPESLVTIDGNERTVLTVATHYSGSLDLPDHFEVTTT
ncbi:hypothetical protein [Brevibacterium oceani]|uniref:hypothetical protein n=1 Tax=Brevibacterium oceani TaxID=358099 RepID=UPI0015E79C88|nr:hypothetical protein [Brevibacterium oceani]